MGSRRFLMLYLFVLVLERCRGREVSLALLTSGRDW